MNKEYLQDCKTYIKSLNDNFTMKVDDYQFIYFDYTDDYENIKIEVVNQNYINNIKDIMNYNAGIMISVQCELQFWSKEDLELEIQKIIDHIDDEEKYYSSL